MIRSNGAIVEDVVALVNRHEGADEKLKKMGVKLHAVAGIKDIVNALYKAGMIDENALESVMKQMSAQGEYETD
jgi:orotate phosphoribosyltransferase